MTIDEFLARVNRAEDDIAAGRVIPNNEMEKRIASWLSQ
jgi:predicted transcriptional regulator